MSRIAAIRPRDTWELLEHTYNSGGRVLVEGTKGTGQASFMGSTLRYLA